MINKVKKNPKKSKPAKKIAKVLKRMKPRILVKKKLVKKRKPAGLKKPKAAKILSQKKIVKKPEVSPVKKTAVRAASAEKHTAEPFKHPFFKAKIRVIGIGGGGSSIVSEIGRSLHKASFVVADTDARAFKKRKGVRQFLFGQQLTHGLGTGLNIDLARRAALQEKEKIATLFQDQDIVILIAALGGGLGSGAAKVFAESLENFPGIIFGIFTLPFKFEGQSKHQIALKSLRELRPALHVSMTIPNERIFKIIDENTAITDAFSMVNRSLIESLESLIDLIYSPGVINIDFADLRSILRGKGNMAFLNTVEASGQDKAEKVIHDILHNPLYQHGNFTADKVLFNIEGGGNLSMFEVDAISKVIGQKNPKAKIIFGISKNNSYKNKIKTTLLMTGPAQAIKTPPPAPIVKAVVKKRPVVVKKQSKAASLASSKLAALYPAPPLAWPSNNAPLASASNADTVLKKSAIVVRPSVKESLTPSSADAKKATRRSALEIKKAEALEADQKSQQEKEWEIPAFLRFKK